jgi:acyl transferase domain-containing protein/surfactin synthase thioesterase subunit/acyl carrier protein
VKAPEDRVLGLLKEARERLEFERRRRTEPIALVGIGCRFPGGASSPAEFWDLLVRGVDATTDVPPDRWDAEALYDPDPSAPGKCYATRGGFLTQIGGFEPEFFGISPREAVAMDPQQRLLLEVAWEALENAGIAPSTLRGTKTGVWVGLSLDDYSVRSARSGQLDRIDAYTALGNARSVAAGRIAYVLGIHGPVMQLDTACSSSLVAVHLACQSLRAGECDVALVGGVNVMSSPEASIALCKLRALSSDGRCKTFDARADGYGRAEGCGIVVLKALSAAQAAGDRVYAVIRGSAVNHDGPSNGLTAPNGLAQEAVISAALSNAGVAACDVSYVEAHGTGTLLGDPIEVLALSRVYGAGRTADAPLHLGSVKTNLGHLEAAAGIAALIKAALCLSKAKLVPSLHFNEPNPRIPWRDLKVCVTTQASDWPHNDALSLAGVSSFGLSGSNAHVILEAPPILEGLPTVPKRSAELVIISARTDAALWATAQRLSDHLRANTELEVGDVAYSAATTRNLLQRRSTLVARTPQALADALERLASGQVLAGTSGGQPRPSRGKLVWLFSGQGAQRLGMGRALYGEWLAFRDGLDAALAAIEPHLARPLRDVMWAEPNSAGAELLHQTAYTQPALFAFEWALAALWRSWGVQPDFVAGHSVGEITAACVAGVFSLDDAARLVTKRGQLMQELPPGGAMVAIAATKTEVADALPTQSQRVSIAAINAPSSVVISGEAAAVMTVAAQFVARGVDTRRLAVSHAFHSALMDPMLEAFQRVAETLTYRPSLVPLLSNLSGEFAGAELATAEYWARHARQTVHFADGVRALQAAGAGSFLELGPKAALLPSVAATLVQHSPLLLAAGRGSGVETEVALEALGRWVTEGGAVQWTGVFPDGGRRRELPTYPWQRERYWLESSVKQRATDAATGHPLLGLRIASAGADATYDLALSTREPSWLSDHRVAGQCIVPGAALLELMRAAATDHQAGAACEVTAMVFTSPLRLLEREAERVQILLTEEGSRASLYSQAANAPPHAPWKLHATASLGRVTEARPSRLDLTALRLRCAEPLDVAETYGALTRAGLDYGRSFQGLKRLWRGDGEALAEAELPVGLAAEGYGLHPALLDAALQVVAVLLGADHDGVFLPFEIERFVVHELATAVTLVHARLTEPATLDRLRADITLSDAEGNVVAQLSGLHARRANIAPLSTPDGDAISGAIFRVEWREAPKPVGTGSIAGVWAVLATGDEARDWALVNGLRQRGASAALVLTTALAQSHAENVVCSWRAEGDAEGALHAADQGLAVVHAIAARQSTTRLWWLTRGAVAVKAEDDVAVAGSSIWGLGRTLMQEHPELHCTLIDLDKDASAVEILAEEIFAKDDETQIAWRGRRRLVARLAPAPVAPRIPQADNYHLESTVKGTLDSLTLTSAMRRAPAATEVEIEVLASGLNFRDVVIALGLYPAKTAELGSECAGVIRRIGREVRDRAVGETVMALGARTFSRFVTVDERAVAAVPAGLSLEQAATLPVAFLTAWYALHDLAGLRAGERIVVHAAAGGVGMAAIQLAHWIGAEVLATASPGKWSVLRSLGVEHLASSRDLSFVEAFRSLRGGADVVLNSLAGEFVDAGLSLLGRGGRFVEMGKTDIRAAASVMAVHPGVAYRAFDLLDAGLDRIQEIFRMVCDGFASGRLKPLPVRSFAVTEAEAAFRFMAQARHVGKLVLLPARSLSQKDGTVLITGGLGALGLEVARALVERGVQHLLLAGRRGISTPGAAVAIAELEALGAGVTVASVDVTDPAALAELLALLPADRPLRGVVHAAGLVDDGLLSAQTPARFARVLAPKVLGAWNLHTLTRRADLELFVLFSSIAGTLGSIGQGAYAAGNGFLDALAVHRRAQGLAGLSLAWGPWSDRGLAAALTSQQQKRFTRLGLATMTPRLGVALFDAALSRPEAQLVLARLDMRGLARSFAGSIPPFWQALVSPATTRRATPAREDWARELLHLSGDERAAMVARMVQAEVARVLSFGRVSDVPLDEPLKDLGLDSLMAVELSNALSRRMGSTISATLALNHPTPASIATFLLTEVLDQARPVAGHIHALDDGPRQPRATAYCEKLNDVGELKLRLFCFHDAGGSAMLFTPLCELGRVGVEIHAVSHARRQPQNASAEEAARYLHQAVAYIKDLSDAPYCLFGHSLGTLFAWRVLQELAHQGVRLPRLFIPSASAPPNPVELSLPAVELYESFMRTVGAARQSEQLRAAFISDVMLCRSLPARQHEPLTVSIVAVLGRRDPVTTESAMRCWSQSTSGEFSLLILPGDHFYLTDLASREQLLDDLARRLPELSSKFAGVTPMELGL